MGTTLEILQAYPLGTLEVEVTANPGNWYGGRGLVRRLAVCEASDGLGMARVRLPQNSGAWIPVEAMTPILYAFEDLCTSLEDGTVPYEELKKMTDYGWRMTHPQYKGCRVDDDRVIERWLSSAGEEYDRSGSLKSHIWGDNITLKAAQYLRRHHFAVGLSPEQFIRKTR